VPVTQLYVSVDAATKDSLKKIDRPLFKDFWERYLDSLRAMRDKGQRTVYRLTLVKAWNTEELDNYAQLVSLGEPDFIEIKVIFFQFHFFKFFLFICVCVCGGGEGGVFLSFFLSLGLGSAVG
jgi:wyosine [tRNA(Phe)-imidazoG37] synthetase (radical SAM superfamily)